MGLEGRDGLRDDQAQTFSKGIWQPLPWGAAWVSNSCPSTLEQKGDGRGYEDHMVPNTASVCS